MEDAYNEGRDNEPEYESYIDNIRSTNNMNVLILKYHAPEIYNTYEYDFNIDDGEYYDEYDYDGEYGPIHKKLFQPTLKLCANFLDSYFKERVNNYINERDANYQVLILILMNKNKFFFLY